MEQEAKISTWHHSPFHLFVPNTFYMVTASTLYKQRLFNTPQKLRLLQDTLLAVLQTCGWRLQAWAVFSNHYHFIACSAEAGAPLEHLIQRLHSQTARAINALDHTPGRRVWFQYWDTCLTYEKSYLARLNYVNNNPVHHRLVEAADQYPFCSAAWFKINAPAELQIALAAIPYDRVNVPDFDC